MCHYQIAPSLLSANFAKLGEEAAAVLNAASEILPLQKIGSRLRELFSSKQMRHIPKEEAADR